MKGENKATVCVKDEENLYSNCDGLPTEAEFDKSVETYQTTFLGKLIPIMRSELPLISLIILCYGCIVFTYTFMKDFRNVITETVLNKQANNWFKLIVFFTLIYITGYTEGLNERYTISNGIKVYVLHSCGFLFILSILVLAKDYFWFQSGWAEFITIGSTFSLRGLDFLGTVLLMVNHFVLSIYFVACEAIGSLLMTTLYIGFLGSISPFKVFKRYLRVLILSINVFSIFTGYFVKKALQNIVNSKQKDYTYVYVGVLWICIGLFGLIYFLLTFIKKEAAKPLYIEEVKSNKSVNMLTKQAKKDKGGMGLTATLRSCINSKLLTSLAILCFSYNFSSFINQTNAECCYEAYYDFLVMNPSQNVKNVVVEKSLLINSFRSMVSNSISLCVIWIMLSPLFNRMFNKLGVLGFSICQPIFSELAAISMLIWATNNLNQIDDVKPAFNFSLPFSFTSNILMECNFAAFFDAAIKITKFAFYDFYVEYIYASIEVSKRSRYKNIVNSVFGKGGQTLGAVVFLLLEMCGMGSKTRQVLPIVFVMISIISIIAIFCCFYLNKIYKEADKNNKFITDDPFFNKSQ